MFGKDKMHFISDTGPTQNLESTTGLQKVSESCFSQTYCLLFYGEVRMSKQVVVFYPLA